MDQKSSPDEKKADAPAAADAKPKPTSSDSSDSGLPKPENLDSNVTDTTQDGGGAANNDKKPEAKKKSPIKTIWDKFNLYLILFILLIVLAAAVVVIEVEQGKKEAASNSGTIRSENLSANALKQLASTGVQVGSPNQVLNVESSAVFSGAVLVRNNLDVAGSLQISDNLTLPSINVSGSSTLAQIQGQSLTLSGTAQVQGLLTAKSGLDVNGDGSFTGTVTTANLVVNSLQLNGSLITTHHITAGGLTPSLSQGNALGGGGTASISGSDTAGTITINTGSSPPAGCFATITFNQPFSTTPHVEVTPVGVGAATLSYYVNRSADSMSICTASAAGGGESFGFDYIIFD